MYIFIISKYSVVGHCILDRSPIKEITQVTTYYLSCAKEHISRENIISKVKI